MKAVLVSETDKGWSQLKNLGLRNWLLALTAHFHFVRISDFASDLRFPNVFRFQSTLPQRSDESFVKESKN